MINKCVLTKVKKPLIGVVLQHTTMPMYFFDNHTITLLAETYFKFIFEMACIPFFISSLMDKEDLCQIVSMIDGLLLTGGRDVCSSTYNEECKVTYSADVKGIGAKYVRPIMIAPNINRDLMEIKLYHLAKQKNVPILGLCRGMQIINIAEGGGLHQEIDESEILHSIILDSIPAHEINIMSDTKCHAIMGVDDYSVPSMHHQSIDKLGDNLLVSAVAADGTIEMIEHYNKKKFIIGIQGHPEIALDKLPKFNNVFSAFVNEVKKGAGYAI